MYDQTGSTEDNPYSGFENEDIFNQFRGGFAGGRRGSHQNINPEDFQSIFDDLFGGMGGGNKRGRSKNTYAG
jgi:DnaJ-class molecular chaperone